MKNNFFYLLSCIRNKIFESLEDFEMWEIPGENFTYFKKDFDILKENTDIVFRTESFKFRRNKYSGKTYVACTPALYSEKRWAEVELDNFKPTVDL